MRGLFYRLRCGLAFAHEALSARRNARAWKALARRLRGEAETCQRNEAAAVREREEALTRAAASAPVVAAARKIRSWDLGEHGEECPHYSGCDGGCYDAEDCDRGAAATDCVARGVACTCPWADVERLRAALRDLDAAGGGR